VGWTIVTCDSVIYQVTQALVVAHFRSSKAIPNYQL